MRANKWCGGLTAFLAASILAEMCPSSAAASDYKLGYNTNASEDDYVFTTKSPKRTIGKSMSIPFRIRATDEDMGNLYISLLETNGFQQIEEQGNGDYSVDYYPFEVMEAIFVAKNVGTIKKGNVRNVSLSTRVRHDALQGYYSIPVLLEWSGGSDTNYINIWISTSSALGTDEEEDKKEGNYFAVGENQPTPRGAYPNVMDYVVNLRNKGEITAQDVTVSMQLSEGDAEFPLEINDGNYGRTFERVQPGKTVSAPYSMAIRKDFYASYYPIKYTIAFRLSSKGDLHTEEGTFYIHTTSKDKEDDLGGFNANDGIRARLIMRSYRTVPEEIHARDEFGLILNMKDVPTSAAISNIFFNLESEKASDSIVFTTESGTFSLVVDNAAPGQTTEIRAKFTTRAGVDQRSYAITVEEKYGDPEFENAEEGIVVDIPVKQYARLSASAIDVVPDSSTVRSESSVMFGINNTGEIIPCNVTVTFEVGSIRTADACVGNIKPGETDSVSTMLTDVAPTLDEGTVHIRVDYENEDGIPAEPVEKELTLMVMEEVEQNWDDIGAAMDAGSMEAEAAPSFWGKYKSLVITSAAAATDVAAAVIVRVRKKREAAGEEDMDDEISWFRDHKH